MLELKQISKVYEVGEWKQVALNNVSINFRKNEFASILGPSGSGKTTMLNIIGGLDQYTSGDLIINGVTTKQYNDREWDSYRNHKIGFVFQSYNLIPHQSVLKNVELALTLSGVTKKEREKRAQDALKDVGLEEHMHKRPNQLSGGQMQRVAIARALINNPDILLADEPTGALDSITSEQIMKLLKKVAKEKLVIMVTHNPELAKAYSTRIINLKDGEIVGDTNPYNPKEENSEISENTKMTSMDFKTALSLSFNNLVSKGGRTLLTAFAGSIGIIGIALILSLSSGVQNYINRVQEETLTAYPLTIEDANVDLTSVISETQGDLIEKDKATSGDLNKIYSNNKIGNVLSTMSNKIQSNNLREFKKYVEKSEELKEYTTAIGYEYDLKLQIYKPNDSGEIVKVNPSTVLDNIGISMEGVESPFMSTDVWSELFENDEINANMYEVVSGRMPKKYNEVVLLVDENNRISDYVLYALGLKDQKELKKLYEKVSMGEKIESIEVSYDYSEIIGLTYKLLLNTDYYDKVDERWVDIRENEARLNEKLQNAEDIEVVGIIRPSESTTAIFNSIGGILYTDDLEKYVIDKINNSDIVKEQKANPTINVITNLEYNDEEFSIEKLNDEQKAYLQSLSQEELANIMATYKEQSEVTYESMLKELGAVDIEEPSAIYLYPKNFESKDKLKSVIDKYNDMQRENNEEGNVINYSDIVGMLMSSVTRIIDIISYVLIGFVSISLVVSNIMIGIITYISVLERTKEIGILRAVGASKKDIRRVFNAETLIIGLSAGIMGIALTLLINVPANIIIETVAGVANLSQLPLLGGAILILISVILTLIAGTIPASIASKKNPVESLRSE